MVIENIEVLSSLAGSEREMLARGFALDFQRNPSCWSSTIPTWSLTYAMVS